MASVDLEGTAKALVADGKGILAADETPQTLTRRFDALHIDSTPESRRAYREMLLTTPGVAEFISGIILQDETIYQQSSAGTPLADVLVRQGIMPGIKVDTRAKPLAGSPGETIIAGLDGLRDRLQEYRHMGARCRMRRSRPGTGSTTTCRRASRCFTIGQVRERGGCGHRHQSYGRRVG